MRRYLYVLLSLVAMIALALCSRMTEGKATVSSAVDVTKPVYTAKLYEGDFDIVAAKEQLASEHADEAIEATDEEIDAALDELTEFVMKNLGSENSEQLLAERNVYVLKVPEEKQAALLQADQSEVYMYTPVLCYSSTYNCWGIFCRMNYLRSPSEGLNGDLRSLLAKDGKTYDQGGMDAYGFSILDADTSKYKSSLKGCTCIIATNSSVIANPTSNQCIYTTSKDAGSGKDGIAFTLQDKSIVVKETKTASKRETTELKYIGYCAFYVAWYDKYFSSYDGNVESWFLHTYSKCELSEVEFGTNLQGKQLSFNASAKLTKEQYSFTAASGEQMCLKKTTYDEAKRYNRQPSSMCSTTFLNKY